MIGPTRPGFRKRHSPRAPRPAEVEDALPPAVRRLCLRLSCLPKRRNQIPRSRLSSSSSWTTASAYTTREVNNAPAWLPKGVAPTHTHSSRCRGEHTIESNRSRLQPKSSKTSEHLKRKVLTIEIEQLQHSKSALDDTFMPTDLPVDEPSEAEALSFN